MLKQKINDIAKDTNDEYYRLIDIIINCINKLPKETILDDIMKESDLQSSLINAVLHPILNSPRRQSNTLLIVDSTNKRPDGFIAEINQRKAESSIGFVEVKAEDAENSKIHEDILRLASFCRDVNREQRRKASIAIHVAGVYITSFLVFETADIDMMVELYSFEAPKYFDQIFQLLGSFDHF